MSTPMPRYRTGDSELDQSILDLLEQAGLDPGDRQLFEMATSVLRLGRQGADRLDLKIVSSTLKELRYAFEVFEPYRSTRKAAVFGSARTPEGSPAYIAAEAIGSSLAAHGWHVITGGGPGIMTAATKGAGVEASWAVAIQLPFEKDSIDSLLAPGRSVNFRYFFNRKLTFMRESSGYVLLPGGFGTLDEAFELLTLLQTGREMPAPVVLFEPDGDAYWRSFRHFLEVELADEELISAEDLELFTITSDVDEAVGVLSDFYRRYHSMRYSGGHLVLRLTEELSDDLIATLNTKYADLVADGHIERCSATDAEIADDDVPELPRVRFRFVDKHFARLHSLIRTINAAPG
ncbi:MAG: TIGR00730 family Rossman fold protein [Microthrixaceae bacterium]